MRLSILQSKGGGGMSYSFETLKWGLAHCYDRDISSGSEPFEKVNPSFWARTSGHTEETIVETMAQIRRDRETRCDPAVAPDVPCEGK